MRRRRKPGRGAFGLLLALLLVMPQALPAQPAQPAQPDQPAPPDEADPAEEEEADFELNSLVRAAFADGRLWLITRAGTLFSIVEGADARIDEDLAEPVLDLCRDDSGLLILTGRRDRGRDWTLRRRVATGWRRVQRVRRHRDELAGMDCSAGRVTLLTSQRIVEIRPGGPSAVDLSEYVAPRLTTALYGSGRHLYVGINAGEWGGGLKRIDRISGDVALIEHVPPSGAQSESLLDAGLDPVQAIVPLPWRPDCVAVAIGLVHFDSNGRLVQVCGTRVEPLYQKNIPSAFATDDRPIETGVAFFGLVRIGDRLVAVGVDGVYRIGEGGRVDFAPFPSFRRIGGVQASFDLPDAVLVVTQINRLASVSVGAPMIVAR